jgi:hypothetical protein
MQAYLAEFELQLKGHNIEFVRACTYRSNEEQDKLYNQSRLQNGPWATNQKGGQSYHNDTFEGEPAANATDYYPTIGGKIFDYDTDEHRAEWDAFGAIAVACGLEWGGNFKHCPPDRPHVQLNKTEYLKLHATKLEG